MGARQEAITQRLTELFAPSLLEVIDESADHAGHVGNPGGGESHFHVRICSEALKGKPLLQQHRAINEALADMLNSGVHALRISIISADS